MLWPKAETLLEQRAEVPFGFVQNHPCIPAKRLALLPLQLVKISPGIRKSSMVKMDFLAARQLRLALERDVSEDYEEAFKHYQNVDPNKERREAVKRKITQYLKRAEEIFTCHLQRSLGEGSPTDTGYSSLRFRPIRTLSSAVENLRRCKVVGVIDKSLPKSHVETRERQTIIPHGVPFMVKLLRYYASEDSIFLHLEHVQGECFVLRACCPHSLLLSTSISFDLKYVSPAGAVPQRAAPRRDPGPLAGERPPPVPKTVPGGGHPGQAQLGRAQARLAAPARAQLRAGIALHGSGSPRGEPAWGASAAGGPPAPGRCRSVGARGHGQRAWAVTEEQVRLWAAEILLALEGLHQQGVLCRDLNPRNLLLDAAGHVRLTFFGQWTEVEPRCSSQALEELYSAPGKGGLSHPHPPSAPFMIYS
uniref:Ribosomal protein S6 kinase like 1 n=1 Tax=Nothoprocta perdicaria TaxID=30464 RepID=A0A8C6Z593_NOTPE